MARSAIAALALCAVLISGCDAMSQKLTEFQTTKYAKERVSTVLDGVRHGKLNQRALTIWFNGTLAVADEHEASYASDMFDRWAAAGGISQGLQTFEIGDSVFEAGAQVPTAIVSGTIDGRAFSVRVPEGQMIAWVQSPTGKRIASSERTPATTAPPRSSPPASVPAAPPPSAPADDSLARSAAPRPTATPRAPIGEGVGPAPLTVEEQAGVAFALLYLKGGASAWQKALAKDSPWSSLKPAEARAEIAARVGPPDGTRWQLQHPGPNGAPNEAVFSIEYPSGMTETLWLDLVGEGGTFKLRRLRTLSEPWPLPPRETPEFEHIAALPGAPRGVAGALLAAAVLLGAAAIASRSRSGRRRLGWATVALAGVAFACERGETSAGGGPAAASAGGPESLGALVPLREALAEGATGDALQPLLAAAPSQGVAGDVARLWRADRMLRDYRLNEADAILATFPTEAPYPLTALLRARLAVLRGHAGDSLVHYELVRSLGADDDGLRLEAAGALTGAEEEAASDRAFDRLTAVGSRLAIPYYVAAEVAMAEDRGEDAEKLFQIGWELQPLSRDVLFRSPLIASVCTRKAVYPLLDFANAAEPQRGGPVPGERPVPLPESGNATLVGQLLRIRVHGAEVRVPGGRTLAPAGTVVEAPAVFERSERDEQVEQLAVLTYQAGVDGAFAQPVLRRRLELAAWGLAEQERWADLLTLTEKLPAFEGRLPPDLTRLRAAALARSERSREAFELLVRLAQDDKQHGRRDTGTLYQLADALVREQRFDLALKVLQRANAMSGLSAGKARERQVRMEKRLAEAHQLFESRYFRIRYPKVTGKVYAQQLAVVLEEERKRLAHWIPVADPQPVDVDLYPVEEFLSSYAAEMPVVGIFDGRVRVPFADLHSLHPQLVAILTHELAHALISQATHERAPKWVQEGLAQHVEMEQRVVNPFPDLEPAGLSLSVAVVDHALDGFSEPQFVELSYAEAAWTFHYLEAKHGTKAIHRLLAAYRKGEDDAAALQSALGMDYAKLDTSLRSWATTKGLARLWPTKVRRYDHEAERLARMAPSEPPPARVQAGATRFVDSRLQQGSAMKEWHATYVKWSMPLKVAYTPVQKALNGNAWTPENEAACRRLAEATSTIVRDPTYFAAPDPRISYPLRQAIVSLNELGTACGRGELGKARVLYNRANTLLTQTASLLGEHKLPL